MHGGCPPRVVAERLDERRFLLFSVPCINVVLGGRVERAVESVSRSTPSWRVVADQRVSGRMAHRAWRSS